MQWLPRNHLEAPPCGVTSWGQSTVRWNCPVTTAAFLGIVPASRMYFFLLALAGLAIYRARGGATYPYGSLVLLGDLWSAPFPVPHSSFWAFCRCLLWSFPWCSLEWHLSGGLATQLVTNIPASLPSNTNPQYVALSKNYISSSFCHLPPRSQHVHP